MTREEAIRWLKVERKVRTLISECQITEALDMAIEALQTDIVRCGECKYWQDNNGGYPHIECRWGQDETPNADDFCSYGERREP